MGRFVVGVVVGSYMVVGLLGFLDLDFVAEIVVVADLRLER